MSHGSCIFSFQFQSNFGGMFDLMWALGSRGVWGQSVAIRAASHERTSNICGPESTQDSHTQGQRDTSLDSFEQTVQCQNILLCGRDRQVSCGYFLVLVCRQTLKIKDEPRWWHAVVCRSDQSLQIWVFKLQFPVLLMVSRRKEILSQESL